VKFGIARSPESCFDRLMSRTVFAEPDRIVGEDVNHVDAHQRRQPERGPAIVAEDEKTRAVGDEAAVERDAVQDGAHSMFADAEVQIASRIVVALEIAPVDDVDEG
jgi:hypothetical protein